MKQSILILLTVASVPLLLSSKTADTDSEKATVACNKTALCGMKLVWSDEFNAKELDSSKWSTNYYSQFDMAAKTNYEDFRKDNLPQPAINFTDSTIILYTNETMPERVYWPQSGRKISSIQTYDWNSDKNKLDEKFVGGYLEARIKRVADKDAEMVNGAFWIDSPGPDLKYYLEEGANVLDATGIRPRGQVFEVDLCENMNTEIVLHGNVNQKGAFERNIGHFIIPGKYADKWVTHGMLWTPRGMKFYIDGKEVASSWNVNDIKSPNHFMNFFLGMYAKGSASMEVDYIRFFQWETESKSEIPNGGFEYGSKLFPWEGDGVVSEASNNGGKYGLTLKNGESAYQYLYLDHSTPYCLSLNSRGGNIEVIVENITLVNGKSENSVSKTSKSSSKFVKSNVDFVTTVEKLDHKKTVRVTLKNNSGKSVDIDNVAIKKSK